MKKILVITNEYPSERNPKSGVFIHKRVLEIKKQGIDVLVYVVSNQSREYFYDDCSVVEGKLFEIRRLVRGLIRRREIEIINVHHLWNLYVLLFINTSKIKLFATSHGSDIHTWPEKDFLYKILLKYWGFNKINKLFFVSRYLKDIAIKLGLSDEKAVISGNGVDLTKVCNKKQLSNNKYVIGYVGNLFEIKGAENLIEIFSIIYRELKDNVSFLVVGDGYLRGELELKAKQQGLQDVIRFTGQLSQENVYSYIAEMSVMLIPSKKEGFSCVAIEALVHGTPIVTTRTIAVQDLLNINWLVDVSPDLVEDMAKSAINIIRNNEKVDAKIIAKITNEYSWEKIVAKELLEYRKVL